ncbi:MAG: cupin-like domain-containing protein, partial [Deltaproteobacteria bacterium]|nr:cupin-like domain-containing protein [Deltaproteobacteria bacterium]
MERLTRPSLERFAVFRRARRPVVLQGLLNESERAAYWTLPSLRERFADRVVSVIPTHEGRISVDVRTGVEFDTVRFGDYVDALQRGERPPAYIAVPAETWLPELSDRVGAPLYCRDAAWRNARFWLGAQTAVPLHRDVAENVFFQLMGHKRFLLYPPAASAWLYSNPLRSALPNFSRFDPEHPDYERFPLSRAVQPVELVLAPGDALYLPSLWWHQVRALDVSASLNFWFADGWLAHLVRAAEVVKRSRGLEIYGLEARREVPRSAPGRAVARPPEP